MADLSELKSDARKAAFARRKSAHAGGSGAAQARLLAHLADIAPDAIVSGYLPIRTEVDPVPVLEALSGRGHRVCVPVIEAKGQPLKFREWRPGCRLVEGPFGAHVPEDGSWLEPDVFIVPLVAFDRDCMRLGYGGGFYDRTLERARAMRSVRAVGFAFAAQEARDLPLEETDQPLDAVVTEEGVILRPGLAARTPLG